ncbi:MAG: hypothetical protein KDD25_03350 [Bdellovibrionales bacterium]|nr:hypothetical protein [Bdellovibrionales bacterium]
MDSATVRSILLFFYFVLMDEKQASQAAQKVVRGLRKHIKDGNFVKDDPEKLVVFVCNQVRKTYKDRKKLLWAKNSLESSWILPAGLDLGPWREFVSDENEEIVDAVVYSKILKFNENSIAHGLGVTVGTLRYRIGNGIRHLGTVVQPGALPI